MINTLTNVALRKIGKRRCTGCRKIKDLEADFYFNEERNAYSSKCRKCFVAAAGARSRKNRSKINEQKRNRSPAIKKMISAEIQKWRKKTGRVYWSLLLLATERDAIKAAAKAAGMTIHGFIIKKCLGKRSNASANNLHTVSVADPAAGQSPAQAAGREAYDRYTAKELLSGRLECCTG